MSLHINAQAGAIAPIVLMPGDPLRAQHIAKEFLDAPTLVNTTRNALFFTGTYKGVKVTVAASGMGCPSIGIYSYELYQEYGVEAIIRVGTCGAYSRESNLYDVINVTEAFSESTYAREAFGFEENSISHQGIAFDCINETAKTMHQVMRNSPIHSSDVFYRSLSGTPPIAAKNHCPAVEMEAFALFANARYHTRMAATLLTVSDIIPSNEHITADQRQTTLDSMTRLALESVVVLNGKLK